MADFDYFSESEGKRRRQHDQLTALRESPEYGAAVQVWRSMMLESFEQWLSEKLSSEDAEMLRQRAIGTARAIGSIDESLASEPAWTEQIKAALHDRDDTRALEDAMVGHANMKRANDMADQGV